MKKIKKKRKFIGWVIFLLLIIVLIIFILKMYYSGLEQQKKIEKFENDKKIVNNLRSTKLFGIKLGDRADMLSFRLQGLAPVYGNIYKVFQDNGLLKGTRLNFLIPYNFNIILNNLVNEVSITENLKNCLELKKQIGETSEDYCLPPIVKNKEFSEYFINYDPRGDTKISSIVAKLEGEYIDSDICVTNLRPYANVIMTNIKKNNYNKNIVIEDNFFPNKNKANQFPKIEFMYNNSAVLTIRGYCLNHLKSSFISINDEYLSLSREHYLSIVKKIDEQEQIKKKEDFEKFIKERENMIDKKGLN